MSAAAAVQCGRRRPALTGARWLVDSAFFPDKLAARGLACLRPDAAERDSRLLAAAALEHAVRGGFTVRA